MRVVVRASLVALTSLSLFSYPLLASGRDDLPAIKVSPVNAVPQCATPGRLMVFLTQRNSKLSERYSGIATEYMRYGEALGLRWDYAFFQMLVETGNLTYTGDVKPNQNNFAGLGATGHGAPGESFKDVSSGVKAHLEHVLMYTGEKIHKPVAERTRNIQDWGVLTEWQKSIKAPITFGQLAKKWAPTSHGYSRDISSVALAFYTGACKGQDPRPGLVAEARGEKIKGVSYAKIDSTYPVIEGKGAEIAKKAIADARTSGETLRQDLGARRFDEDVTNPPFHTDLAPTEVRILNKEISTTKDEDKNVSKQPVSNQLSPNETNSNTNLAAATILGSPNDAQKKTQKESGKCNVWTASYGGTKAMIIKASGGGATNYTVLDVNEGSEKKEAEAYISAYAKGGQMIGEFPSSTQALDKAFELCPES